MTTQRATFRGTREDLYQILRTLPAMLAGTAPDPWGIVYGLQVRLGVTLLSLIKQAFLIKSRGGTDECGITWPPLKPETIAQRRTSASERKAAGVGKGNNNRGLLTAAEDQRWRQIFGTRTAALVLKGVPLPAAKAQAAQIAWATLKGEGAKTKLALFGSRQVDILRDTDELFKSLSPGVEGRPSGAEGQIFRVQPGMVIVGTNKKPWHHKGVPGRLPARNLWPLDGNLPAAWWTVLNGSLQRGLLRALADVLSSRGAA